MSTNAIVTISTANSEMDTNSAPVAFSQAAGCDPVPKFHSLQPIPHQTSVNPWPILYPSSTCTCSSWTSSGSTGHTTSRRSSEQGEILATTHRYEAAARQNLVNTLATRNEARNYNVQMQLEHEADVRFSPKTTGTVIATLSESISSS